MKTGIRVSDAMTFDPISVPSNTTLDKCAKIMKEKDIGSVLIKDNEELKGILTEWDIVRRVVAENKDPKKTSAGEIMVQSLVTVHPNKDLFEAVSKMRDNDIRHLPVVDNNEFVGFLTMKDILKIQPELFEILVENFDLREEREKGIGQKMISGECGMCGKKSSTLIDVNGIFLCRECR